MRERDDDRQVTGGTAEIGAPSDPGPGGGEDASAAGLVEAVAELLDDLVEAPAAGDDGEAGDGVSRPGA